MNVRTFERLLHSKEEWHQTIEDARAILRYSPSWSWEQRRLWDDQSCQADEQFTNFMALTFLAEKVIGATEFPGQKTLELYWIACFYNDYEALGLDAIKLWPPHWEAPRRVYPYLEWRIDYDTERGVLHLDIPKRLLTKELLKEIPDIKAKVTGEKKGLVSPDIHRAKVRRKMFIQRPEVAHQERRASKGELTYINALKEEYRYTLKNNRSKIDSAPDKYIRLERLQYLRKLVRERVRNRFKRADIPIIYKPCNWWTMIEEDIL